MRIVASTSEGISEAAQAVRDGLLVVYPTDTLYGIGADPFSREAIGRVFACKGRSKRTPLLVIAADLEQVSEVVAGLSPAALRFADTFWPGPLSLLLPRSARIPEELTAGSPKVSIRIPANETARALCAAVGHAIVSTSVNPAGGIPVQSLAEVTLPGIAVGIDSGRLPASPPSTVYDPETDTIVRPGAISAVQLARCTSL